MAEILVKAVNATHSDTDKDRSGCYKRGMPVIIMPDGHSWGGEERLPKFILIKVPGISVDLVKKYVDTQLSDSPDEDGRYPIYRRRLWRIRLEDIPVAARNILANTGMLVIKAGKYNGEYDYTWKQIRAYFRNLKTGIDESGNL